MTRNELISVVAEATDKTKVEVEEVIRATEKAIVEKVSSGEKVVLSGFAKFDTRDVAAREQVIPSTKKKKMIPEHKAVTVKVLKAFKESVK